MFIREKFEIRLNSHKAVFQKGPHFPFCTHSPVFLFWLTGLTWKARVSDMMRLVGVMYFIA